MVHNTDDMSFEAGEEVWAKGSRNCLTGATKSCEGTDSTSRPTVVKATAKKRQQGTLYSRGHEKVKGDSEKRMKL